MLQPAIGVATVLALWWIGVAASGIRPFFLPGPADIVNAFTRRWAYLLEQAGVTIGHTLAGFGIAVAAGLTTAMLLAASSWLRGTTLPLLVALQAVPKVAIAPLLLIWLGFGHEAKIALVALLSFFPVVLSTMAGLRATPAELVDLARSLDASRWTTYIKIRLPYALPQVFVGLKLAISLALIGAVVAQITTPNAGLGAVIVRAGAYADTPLAFAAIVCLSGIGLALFYGLTGLERLLLPWARPVTA